MMNNVVKQGNKNTPDEAVKSSSGVFLLYRNLQFFL